jgi:glycerol-3-phosphate acyltransferase PlsX
MRIGVDIMGGDFAPKKTIHGAILAQEEFTQDVKIVLFGDKKIIISELKKTQRIIK